MREKPKPIIYSIGHSVKPIDIFLDKLKDHNIQILVDVRSSPYSRFSPHFNKNALQDALAKRTIKYLWRGQNLGGRGVNVGWDEAIEELADLAKKGEKVAVMCSEGDYRKCHRYTTITPALEKVGVMVIHTEYENSKKTTKGHK